MTPRLQHRLPKYLMDGQRWIAFFICFLPLACSGQISQVSSLGNEKSEKSKSALKGGEGKEETSEERVVSEPQMVSGTFLTCSRVSSTEDPQGGQVEGEGIGCGIRNSRQQKVLTSSYDAKASLSIPSKIEQDLVVRKAPDESRWNYFVYFKRGVIEQGVLNLILNRSGEKPVSLSFPMSKIQETSVAVAAEQSSVNDIPNSSASIPSTTPNSQVQLQSSHSWTVPKAYVLADDFRPSMFCQNGSILSTIQKSSFTVPDELFDGASPVLELGSPDILKASCFGILDNEEDLDLKKYKVVYAKGCMFMRDQSKLYVFSGKQLAENQSTYRQEYLENLAIQKPGCVNP